ncbi:cupin domain-containing protein [Desulforamulus ruminis]|uniref:cupin domain-containing protein n=1 Tax=Desulforamulus ruminis TaxID=1564 RepID=UPI002352CE7D|nr:cupin domain-containing protein [Desulforamulus ruminis]
MEIVTIKDAAAETGLNTDAILKTLFKQQEGTKFGTVVIPPGVRIPREGTGVHGSDEYSLVLKGTVTVMSSGKEYQVTSGQATLIPAGEAHWSMNRGSEDCEIVWVLI